MYEQEGKMQRDQGQLPPPGDIDDPQQSPVNRWRRRDIVSLMSISAVLLVSAVAGSLAQALGSPWSIGAARIQLFLLVLGIVLFAGWLTWQIGLRRGRQRQRDISR